MPHKITLAEAYEQIVDSLIRRFNDETKPGGELDEIKQVVDGDKLDYAPDHPALWVWADDAHVIGETSMVETWELPVILAVVYYDNNPVNGRKQAQKLVAKSRSVARKNRRLGLPFVQDVRSAYFIPNTDHETKSNLYGAGAAVNVIFNVIE